MLPKRFAEAINRKTDKRKRTINSEIANSKTKYFLHPLFISGIIYPNV
jgi:hypothetical protein